MKQINNREEQKHMHRKAYMPAWLRINSWMVFGGNHTYNISSYITSYHISYNMHTYNKSKK